MGEGPIPFTAIDLYARRYGLRGLGEFDRLRALIRAMDGDYLKTRAPKDPQSKGFEVPITDGAGVKSILGSLGARHTERANDD